MLEKQSRSQVSELAAENPRPGGKIESWSGTEDIGGSSFYGWQPPGPPLQSLCHSFLSCLGGSTQPILSRHFTCDLSSQQMSLWVFLSGSLPHYEIKLPINHPGIPRHLALSALCSSLLCNMHWEAWSPCPFGTKPTVTSACLDERPSLFW